MAVKLDANVIGAIGPADAAAVRTTANMQYLTFIETLSQVAGSGRRASTHRGGGIKTLFGVGAIETMRWPARAPVSGCAKRRQCVTRMDVQTAIARRTSAK
jgi:hypothetical protein